MRLLLILTAIALPCLPLFASVAYGSAAESLIFQMLSGNETFTYSNFTEDGIVIYYLAKIDGTERVLVRAGPLPGQGAARQMAVAEAVTEAPAVSAVLKKIYAANGADESALSRLPPVHALLQKFSASRQPGEHKCDILIGMDEHQCIDFDSCQKSCYSRTSFCQLLAIGIGRPLIEAMIDYSNGTKNLTILLAQEAAHYAALQDENKTAQDLDSYLGVLTEINMQATRINNNPIFYSYQMCYPANYDMASLTRAKLDLLSIYPKAMPILLAGERSRQIAEFSSGRLAALPEGKRRIIMDAPLPAPPAAGGANESQNITIPKNTPANATPGNGIANAMNGGARSVPLSQPSQNGAASPQQPPALGQPIMIFAAVAMLAVLLGAYVLFARKKKPAQKKK